MAQVPPPNLHDTSDIRFVMVELGKYGTRLDSMEKAIEKLGGLIESSSEKLEKTLVKQLDTVEADVKTNSDDIKELDKKVAWVKGAAWVFGVLGILVTLILGAILAAVARKLIG